MKTSIFKLTSLLLMFLLGMGSASASFTVRTGKYTTLTFVKNSADTNTVTLVKCVGGEWSGDYGHGGILLVDKVIEIPETVTVNGAEKTVVQIGGNTNSPVYENIYKVVFPSTVKKIGKNGLLYTQEQYSNMFQVQGVFDFSKATELEAIESDYSYPSQTPVPMIENLTVRNDVELGDAFPYGNALNLACDESSTVYDCVDGCLFKKGDRATMLTFLSVDEVVIPNAVIMLQHDRAGGALEAAGVLGATKKTKVTFENPSSLESIKGLMNNCVLDSLPSTVKQVTNSNNRFGREFYGTEFLSFTMPADLNGFSEVVFAGTTFNEVNWGENPQLHKHLFAWSTFNKDLSLPEGVTSTRQAFYGATFKGALQLPESFTLQEDEFENCTFHNEVVMSAGVKAFPNRCFNKCTFFKRFVLPEGMETINASFLECDFRSGLELPESLKSIGSGAFARSKLNNTTLEIPAGVNVDKGAFVSCEIYKMIWNGDKFDALGSAPYLLDGSYFDDFGAIRKVYSVKILDLGTSVPDLYSLSPFAAERIYTHCTTPPEVRDLIYVVHEVADHYSATLYVPKGSKSVYERTAPWSYFTSERIVEFDETQEMPFVGDVNGDGRINVSDIAALVNDILDGPTEQSFLNDDVNEDSKVNVSDISTNINKILGIK